MYVAWKCKWRIRNSRLSSFWKRTSNLRRSSLNVRNSLAWRKVLWSFISTGNKLITAIPRNHWTSKGKRASIYIYRRNLSKHDFLVHFSPSVRVKCNIICTSYLFLFYNCISYVKCNIFANVLILGCFCNIVFRPRNVILAFTYLKDGIIKTPFYFTYI